MERLEKGATGKSFEQPRSNWPSKEHSDNIGKVGYDNSTIEKPVMSAGRPQKKIERPVSRRGLQSAAGEAHIVVAARATTPAENTIARPPSPAAYSQRMTTGSLRLCTMSTSNSMMQVNTGLASSIQMNMNPPDRPVTQQGIAGTRPGTTTGLPMNRQIQDKRYYEGLVQLKIRELCQEISGMSHEIDTQNKEMATFLHYDNRAKELAAELTGLQGQLADYNIVIDKMTSNIEHEAIEDETHEIAVQNDRTSMEIDRLFEQKRFKEQQIRDITEKIDSEQKNATRIIESMDRVNRDKYNELNCEKSELEVEIGKMQKEIDLLSGERRHLEEQITLSQIKQEAVRLRIKLGEIEGKRDKLQEEQKNKLSPEEERERLLAKVKQDNMEIAAAERRIADAERQINEVEQELEQLETDLEDNQSEKQVKYRELKKREEAMEQFMPSFNHNKKDEMDKLENLERTVVERLLELSCAVDKNVSITPSEEIALLKIQNTFQEYSDESSIDQSFEEMTKEHTRLQTTLDKIQTLEKRLKKELNEIKDKLNQKQNELVVLEDLDGLKARSEMQHEDLISEINILKEQQPICRLQFEKVKSEYEAIKKLLNNNETYLQINALEGKLDKLKENNINIEKFITEGKSRVNYQSLKEQSVALLNQHNNVLKENVKSNY